MLGHCGELGGALEGRRREECGAVYPLSVPRQEFDTRRPLGLLEIARAIVPHSFVPVLPGALAKRLHTAFLRHAKVFPARLLQLREAGLQVVL